MTLTAPPSLPRLARALLIAAGLLGVTLCLAAALLLAAVRERVVVLPNFVWHVGHYYVSAPCPAPTLVCDPYNNYYAVWTGHDLPDGRIHFDELYFTYLKPKH